MLSNLRDYQDGSGSEDNKSTESWSTKIVSFQLTFAAFLLFTASFTFIGILSAPMLTQFDEAQNNKQLEYSNPLLQITYLPFYSSAAVFTVLNFLVYGTFIGIINCVRYMRYGVCNSNDYYTQE